MNARTRPVLRPHIPAALRPLAKLAAGFVVAALGACSGLPFAGQHAADKNHVLALTDSQRLLRFQASQPGRILSSVAVSGLAPGDALLDIDFRMAKGQLYGLGRSGQLYRIDPATGAASPIGTPLPIPLSGDRTGIDFNPTVDRLRVVGSSGQNLRMHPDTGALVDGNAAQDGPQGDALLRYAEGDMNAGRIATVVAAAYTYNKDDEKITTNYAIDANFGTLVMQGSREGVKPVVSPNTGLLRTVGSLKVAPFQRAAFDISDTRNQAYAALSGADGQAARWVDVDLASGAARAIGTIGGGEAIRGIAIEP